jgi:hypothetical protein
MPAVVVRRMLQAGGVAGDDFLRAVERDDAVRHRFEHRLVVVLDLLDVGKQLGVFQRDRNLRGEGAQPRFVLVAERTATLVEHLRHADDLAGLVDDRHAQDGAREVAGALVERRVEAQVGVGVRDVDGLAGREDGAGDTGRVRQADLQRLQALSHFGPQLAGFSSLRNRVERSALSRRVASPITFCSSEPSLMSAVTSDTTSMNSISWRRIFFMLSRKRALCSASVPWVVSASSNCRSARVKACRAACSAFATRR